MLVEFKTSGIISDLLNIFDLKNKLGLILQSTLHSSQ
jgi:hypothetical protein